jgi:hypothetical protein
VNTFSLPHPLFHFLARLWAFSRFLQVHPMFFRSFNEEKMLARFSFASRPFSRTFFTTVPSLSWCSLNLHILSTSNTFLLILDRFIWLSTLVLCHGFLTKFAPHLPLIYIFFLHNILSQNIHSFF